MNEIVLTAHTLIVLGLIVVVLLQRSDGAALGLGGGGGAGGGFMSGRGAANALTRLTSVLAAGFFATSLSLAVMAGGGESEDDIIEQLTGESAPIVGGEAAPVTTDDLLNTIGVDEPAVEPSETTPSETTPTEDGDSTTPDGE